MVMCDYAYYNPKEILRQKIYCKHNGKICLYSKYCVKVGKFVPSDGMENCFMALNENKKIPSGARRVRFIKKGFLYIEMDNGVIKVKNNTINEVDYVYVRKTNGEYEVSLSPFVEEVVITPVENEIDDAIEPIIIDDDLDNDANEENVEEEIPEEEVVKPKKKRRYNRKKKAD